MILSDVSIKRPVVCLVAALLIVIVGLIAFNRLPVREFPDTDSPVVSVSTNYPGAAPEVVETQITDVLEEQISSIDGIKLMRSESSEQRSRITLEFDLRRNVDEAANDVRDRVSRARRGMPTEADEPEVSKADSDDDPILTLSFNSEIFSRLELSEMARRVAAQRIQTVPGVAGVNLRGPQFAMRMWLDAERLAAYELTVADVERALRQQNVDLPSGRIESLTREFTVRLQGRVQEVSDFENLVLVSRAGYLVRFSDVGRVELGADDYRIAAFYNGRNTVAIQVLRQSQANLLEVAGAVKGLVPEIRRNLPDGVNVEVAYDTSVFVERSVREVFGMLFIAGLLVVLTIFCFLRDWRATVIPLIAIPVSILGAFALMQVMGFSLNLLTLLALVLAVGLVVDDAIVMLENIYRRIENGEKAIRAAIFGSRQMAFAIIATTLTLIAVFVPVAFQSGQTGRLFYEFGITLALAVSVSSFIALTLTPMLCSRILKGRRDEAGNFKHGKFYDWTEPFFVKANAIYASLLRFALGRKVWVLVGALVFSVTGPWLYTMLQRELTPSEDRGIFRVLLNFPMGSTPEYSASYAEDVETVIRAVPEVERMFRITGIGGAGSRGFAFVTLKPWEERERGTEEILNELRGKLGQNTGGLMLAAPIRPLGGRRSATGGVQMVLQGPDFAELQAVGRQFESRILESEVLGQPRISPQPNKPQLNVRVDRAKAADLDVPVLDVATTLESLFGGRRVTKFRRGADEYDVVVQVEDAERATPSDLGRIYVRSTTGNLVQLGSLVEYDEEAVPEGFPHLNRQRAITLTVQLAQGMTQGDGVVELERIAAELLPDGFGYAWEGETKEYVDSTGDAYVLFGLALLFTFLILAAQFESWVHPVTIFTGVAVAISGGIIVLYASRWWGVPMTDNLFSRFALIMLIGLVAKNGILIVEFANQLQVEGRAAAEAAFEAATLRFRPILMTAISTILGALPLALASGPGAESRNPMGVVIVGGLGLATLITLFLIPIVYMLMDRLVVVATGQSSAQGLKQAAQIDKDVATEEKMVAPAA